MGVQLPGPDDASVEAGFDATGEDMHWQAPRGNDIPGVHMGHGSAESEAGWLDGSDMRGLTSPEPIPSGNNMGSFSDAGSNTGDLSASAGFHRIDSFEGMYSDQGGIPMGGNPSAMGEGPSMAGLPVGAVSNQGYPNGGSQQGGIDSMEGLEFYGGPAPQGLQDSYNSGPGVMGNGAEPGGDDQAAVGR